MRAFYRCPPALDLSALPGLVTLTATDAGTWVLSDHDPRPDLEAAGGVRLGARLSDLAGADLDACQNPDAPGTPRTIFAGDAVEDYQ